MKIKVADYIAKLLVENGITQNFTVVGGGAMHLNDAFGHREGMNCLYQHHEQACAMAAESYARIYNRPALLCVTSGPGGTNAITGVLGAWLDSLPMIVISGQVRYDNTARWAGVKIRAMGDQEFDICQAVSCMTKYCEMLTDPMRVRYAVEKCIYLSQTGRPGPCWLDIPVNIQGSYVEEEELVGFDPKECNEIPPKVSKKTAEKILDKIAASERPVFYTGNGIRIAGAETLFLKLAKVLNIPVVTGWNGEDIIPEDSPLYAGRPGGRGDRPGNLAVQNADLIFSAGSRLSIRQVGYDFKSWAREAYTIVCDIDPEELKKPSVHVSMPVHADAKDLFETMLEVCEEKKIKKLFKGGKGIKGMNWLDTCQYYRSHYPVIIPEYLKESEEPANVYAVVKYLSEMAKENQVTVVGNGSACVVGGQAYKMKKGSRFISQSAVASMGYDLPAAIGACAAVHGPDSVAMRKRAEKNPYWKGCDERYPNYKKHDIICLTGDGSLQMNLQELQTIVHHKMPIKIVVINNGGYHSIRQTQKNFFGDPLVGVGVDSGLNHECDLSFPNLKRLAKAYRIPFCRAKNNQEIVPMLQKMFQEEGPAICEILVSLTQEFLPKSAAKKLPDGSLISPPLEDMAPFLPDEEMDELMIVKRKK